MRNQRSAKGPRVARGAEETLNRKKSHLGLLLQALVAVLEQPVEVILARRLGLTLVNVVNEVLHATHRRDGANDDGEGRGRTRKAFFFPTVTYPSGRRSEVRPVWLTRPCGLNPQTCSWNAAQRSFALAFLATHRRRWCLSFCLASPPAIFYPRCEKHPRRADRANLFFGKSRVLRLPRAAPPYDDVASTNI